VEKLRNEPNIRNFGLLKHLNVTFFKRLAFIMSVRLSAWNKSVSIGQIFMNFCTRTRGFFENVSRKFKFDSNLTRIMGTLHEYLYIYIYIYIYDNVLLDSS